MIQTNLLRGKMVENGYSSAQMAKELGITPRTFYNRMKKGVFGSDEIYKMISILNIQNPIEIFFCPENSAASNYREGKQ